MYWRDFLRIPTGSAVMYSAQYPRLPFFVLFYIDFMIICACLWKGGGRWWSWCRHLASSWCSEVGGNSRSSSWLSPPATCPADVKLPILQQQQQNFTWRNIAAKTTGKTDAEDLRLESNRAGTYVSSWHKVIISYI